MLYLTIFDIYELDYQNIMPLINALVGFGLIFPIFPYYIYYSLNDKSADPELHDINH